jgi:undecaprenyl diphosphate synthase
MNGVRNDAGLHVGIIMDGNGRWARSRGLPRVAGHARGVESVRCVVESAPPLGISVLTLYAFSSDNWSRPAGEVAALMKLLERYLIAERRRCVEQRIRLSVIGRRDRLEPRLVREIRAAEEATVHGDRLYLRIAVDYSSRRAILGAARMLARDAAPSYGRFLGLINRAAGSDPQTPEVDLIIRTSGEKRLSDFLLWESAYAEILFTDRLWPDFDGGDLQRALDEFRRRERRFGRLSEAAV